MNIKKRGQISTEYLIIVGFITFVVISVLGLAYVYVAQVKDTIKINQIENFANKIISSSESIFYAGEPSTVTITGYIPSGVTNIQVNGKEIIFTVQTRSGTNVMSFASKVTIEGTISPSSGVKKLQLVAREDKVTIN